MTVCTRNNGTDSFRTLISSVPACALHRYYLTFIKQCLISPQRRETSCANAHLLPFIRFKSSFFSPRLCLAHSPCLVFIHLIPSFALFQTLLPNYSSKPPLPCSDWLNGRSLKLWLDFFMPLCLFHSVETVIHVHLTQPPLISCNVAFISLAATTISSTVSRVSILFTDYCFLFLLLFSFLFSFIFLFLTQGQPVGFWGLRPDQWKNGHNIITSIEPLQHDEWFSYFQEKALEIITVYIQACKKLFLLYLTLKRIVIWSNLK